jgi:hypothetical protein
MACHSYHIPFHDQLCFDENYNLHLSTKINFCICLFRLSQIFSYLGCDNQISKWNKEEVLFWVVIAFDKLTTDTSYKIWHDYSWAWLLAEKLEQIWQIIVWVIFLYNIEKLNMPSLFTASFMRFYCKGTF